ncbi:hypothetical protein BZG02_14265 [Labilibaculum filiforme]|uniref:BIG2 domain-containing protein n=2 Tax=Labilibaculum filiforme TaxID=1940526 RepID=A0A2N3HVN3_9BACT|nr:hypothetical protein BZG02_14265 [Labilibaculum filiforme]
MFFAFTMCLQGYSQLRTGDPGVTIDRTKFDSNYPQMNRWANAGVRGGIPFISSFDKTATISPGNSTTINSAIKSLSNSLKNGEKGLLTLQNGIYTINSRIEMKSNVSLRGQSRSGVKCSITMTNSDAFSFDNVKNCGLYNLTIQGSWGTPKYPWNYSLDENREFNNSNISVKLKNGTTDCWLDKLTILNSANDPMRCPADHNTFRDLIVDGCKRKAGGAEGYFFIQGRDNLVTGCEITHLRHISLQGSNVEYNVVYDNDFRQEISFHSGDNGNNLITENRITLPSDMPPINKAEGESGPYPETENNKPNYFAIMGPWSIQHQVSAHPNFLYKNKCVQNNHNYGTRTPWSDNEKVYSGPIKIGKTPTDHINNFPVYSKGVPNKGTLYAINLNNNTNIAVTNVSLTPASLSLTAGATKTLTPNIVPSNANNKSVSWLSNNASIASVNNNGVVTAVSAGSATITVKTADKNKTATCTVLVSTPNNNNAPIVSFNKPTNNKNFSLGSTVSVEVNATDNERIDNVKLFLNDIIVRQENVTPYRWADQSNNDPVLRNMHTGTYTLKAVATDNSGLTTTKYINITVGSTSSRSENNTSTMKDLNQTTLANAIKIDANNVEIVKIFPNPFSTEINITTNGEYYNSQLIDHTGRVVYQQALIGPTTILNPPYSEVPKGLYILKLMGKNSNKTQKLIRQ